MGIERRPGICKECGKSTAWHVPQEDCSLCALREEVSRRDQLLGMLTKFARANSAHLEEAIQGLLAAEQVSVPESEPQLQPGFDS